MLEIVDAAAAFDVAAGDIDDRLLHILLTVERTRNEVCRSGAECRLLLRRQGSVVTGETIDAVETSRRSDLGARMVVHEHHFEVRLRPRSDLIFGERAERVALVRTLEVIVRR